MTHPRDIELLVLDVDGVLTDGLIHIDDAGVETKTFHVRDGAGIVLWIRLGYHVAIITGRTSTVVELRAAELGIRHVHQGVRDKRAAFDALVEKLGISPDRAAVMGDDLADLPLFRGAGYAIAVADADETVRSAARLVTARPGGRGAVREAVEHLLKAKERWDEALGLPP